VGHLDGLATRPWMVLHHTPRLVWSLPSNSKGPHLAHEGDRPHEVALFEEKYHRVFSMEQQGYKLGQRGQAVGGKCGRIRFGDKA